jgi:hypothetical protein
MNNTSTHIAKAMPCCKELSGIACCQQVDQCGDRLHDVLLQNWHERRLQGRYLLQVNESVKLGAAAKERCTHCTHP